MEKNAENIVQRLTGGNPLTLSAIIAAVLGAGGYGAMRALGPSIVGQTEHLGQRVGVDLWDKHPMTRQAQQKDFKRNLRTIVPLVLAGLGGGIPLAYHFLRDKKPEGGRSIMADKQMAFERPSERFHFPQALTPNQQFEFDRDYYDREKQRLNIFSGQGQKKSSLNFTDNVRAVNNSPMSNTEKRYFRSIFENARAKSRRKDRLGVGDMVRGAGGGVLGGIGGHMLGRGLGTLGLPPGVQSALTGVGTLGGAARGAGLI